MWKFFCNVLPIIYLNYIIYSKTFELDTQFTTIRLFNEI